jgi:hypothetical protein
VRLPFRHSGFVNPYEHNIHSINELRKACKQNEPFQLTLANTMSLFPACNASQRTRTEESQPNTQPQWPKLPPKASAKTASERQVFSRRARRRSMAPPQKTPKPTTRPEGLNDQIAPTINAMVIYGVAHGSKLKCQNVSAVVRVGSPGRSVGSGNRNARPRQRFAPRSGSAPLGSVR